MRGLLAFDEVTAEIPSGEGFLIDPRGDAPLTSRHVHRRAGRPRASPLVVGPEAGFSEGEVRPRPRAPACRSAHLGPAVLRAETAAIAAVTIAASAGWEGARD